VPRNATPVFNLGLAGMDVMFWDGRVQGTVETEFASSADDDLPFGLDNAVAVQAMFPVTSRDEMRGQRGNKDVFGERNELASISDHNWQAIWVGLMERILAVPGYQEMFRAAYPDLPLDELGFEHAANAMAAYQMEVFTFLDSPWDRYLQGDETALSAEAMEGALLFYGKAGCVQCHSGPLMSDLQFHNIGVPQVGPGKGAEEPFDFGRARETGSESDLYAFRTPPLRNVAITGPYMHNGVYLTLEEAVRHHLNPAEAVANCDVGLLSPLMQEEDSGDTAVHTAPLSSPSIYMLHKDLSGDEVAALLAFLESLTSPSAENLQHTIPDSVPSGLPVDG
jgi:cytochrome c peroxidase